jgi:hypothetical protein
VFVAMMKPLDSDTTASESTTSFSQPHRLTSEKYWVPDLVSEFYEVFEDPLLENS